MADQNSNQLDRVLAFLSPECLDQLCDLIIAKLEGRNPWVLPKQDVVGSNPITRSTSLLLSY